MSSEFGGDLVGWIGYDGVTANWRFGLLHEVADEMQLKVVITDQIGADDGMAAITQHVGDGTAPCAWLVNPVRHSLGGEQRFDGDRRSRVVQVESPRGLRVPSGLTGVIESADAADCHGAALARRRNAGIERSSGSETDAVAGTQVATMVAEVGAELYRPAVAPRQCTALARSAAATASAIPTMAQWYRLADSGFPAATTRQGRARSSLTATFGPLFTGSSEGGFSKVGLGYRSRSSNPPD
jgi:hypothetical protein